MMRTTISIPDEVFALAERLAKRLGISRSELYTRAVRKYVDEHRHAGVTEKLNEVYSEEHSPVDPAWFEAQADSTDEEDW